MSPSSTIQNELQYIETRSSIQKVVLVFVKQNDFCFKSLFDPKDNPPPAPAL